MVFLGADWREARMMAGKFLRIDREAGMLLPPSIGEWVGEDHLARFVVEIVEQLDLSQLEAAYQGVGRKAYPPEMLLALLFYGYATGVYSSRKLEAATYDSVAFRFVAGDLHPDHDTIATFRKRFQGELSDLFVQILGFAQEMGFLRLGQVSLDGTKVKANASRRKAMSFAYLERLEKQLREEVAALLELAERADADAVEVDLPEELRRREDRLGVIAAAKVEMERRAALRHEAEMEEHRAKMAAREEKERKTGRKTGGRPPKEPEPGPRPKDQVNFTDPDSRIMKSSEGFVQAYNAQAVVDHGSHLIVSQDVSNAANDKQQVDWALEALADVEDVVGTPEALAADSGYYSAENLEKCEASGIAPHITAGREGHNAPLEERLEAQRVEPEPCPPDADAAARARHRLATPEGKAIYAKRKATVETVFGVIKEVMGFRRFQLRGLEAA